MVSNLIQRTLSGIVLGAGLIYAIFQGGALFQILMAICGILMAWEWLSINPNKKTTLFFAGLVYLTLPIIFWVYNSALFPASLSQEILWCFLIVWGCDIFAYFGGKLMKGPKFAPKISPNKTWSGVFSGSIMAFVISYIYITNVWDGRIELVIMSVFMIIASILGDLLESKVKRVLQVKDTGNIIPGHGGVCDRLDSFLLVTYVFALVKFIFL